MGGGELGRRGVGRASVGGGWEGGRESASTCSKSCVKYRNYLLLN